MTTGTSSTVKQSNSNSSTTVSVDQYSSPRSNRRGLSRELKKEYTPYSPPSLNKKIKAPFRNQLTRSDGSVMMPLANASKISSGNTMMSQSNALTEQISSMNHTVDSDAAAFAWGFIHSLFNTDESVGILLNAWVFRPFSSNPLEREDVYAVIKAIAFDKIDIRLEMRMSADNHDSNYGPTVITRDGDGGITFRDRRSEASASGHVSIFSGSTLSIPLSALSNECITFITAMCTSARDCFATVENDDLRRSVTYSDFAYNRNAEVALDRRGTIDRMVNLMLLMDPCQYSFTKEMLITVFHKFKGEEWHTLLDNYKRLLSAELRFELFNNALANEADRSKRNTRRNSSTGPVRVHSPIDLEQVD